MADRVISYDFRANFTNLTAGLTAGGRAVKDFGGKLTALDKQGAQTRRGLDTIGTSAGRMGLVAAAGIGAIAVATANFEQSMSKVAATGEDARASLGRLEKAALDAGAATAFSATEAAAGIENLLKAGVSVDDVLAGGLSGALDLAAAGGLEVADAAEAAATAMTQFGLSGSEVPHIADLLAAAAGKAQGEVSDMNYALSQSGLVANQMGLSIEETTGGLAAFASAGLLGSDAGTSFKTMLGALTPNSVKAREAMNELGISAFDAQGNFIGLAEFAGELQGAMANMSTETRQATLETIFGSDAVRAASVIYDEGEQGIRGWIGAVNDQGYAAETAATKLDNLKGDVEELGGALETALIGSGEGSTGILREMTQGVTGLVNAFNELPAPLKNATTGMLAITAITGGGLWFTSKVVGGIADTKDAMKALGIEATLTKGKLAATATSAGVFALVATSFMDTLSATDTWSRGREAAQAMADNITELTDALQASNVGKFAAELGIDVQRLAEDLHRNGEEGEYAKEVIDKLNDSSEGLGNNMSLFASDILPMWTSGASKAWEAGDDLNDIISNNTDLMGAAADAANRATYGIAGIGPTLDVAARAAMGAAGGFEAAGGEAEGAKEKVRDFEGALESLTGWLDKREAMRSFNDSVRELGKSIKNGFGREDVENLDNIGRNIVQVAESIKDKELRADFLAGARESLRDLADKAGPKAQREIEGLIRQLKILERQNPTVTVDTTAAERGINRLRTALSNIPDEEVFVSVRRKGGDQPQLADGGTVTGQRYPYADKRLYLLAPGEEVISNRYGQADRNRTLLKMINANRAADGATVGWERRVPMASSFTGSSGAGVSIDYDRLASAVANARPPQLYGDVHVSDGYGGFKRAMMEDRARANFDGVVG